MNCAMKTVTKCMKCSAALTRRKIVIGRGSIPAKILFIGEAPGRTEDLFGEPFVGRSGRLLESMLLKAGIVDKYYITNCLRCRPTDSADQNREPTGDEVLACMPNVLHMASRVHPEIVVFIGKVAESYYKKHFPITASILHPSFVLRKGGENSPWFEHNVSILRRVADAVNHTESLFTGSRWPVTVAHSDVHDVPEEISF